MVFAPKQTPAKKQLPSCPFNKAYIPDFKPEFGRKLKQPVKLSDWVRAKGSLQVTVAEDKKSAIFDFSHLIPNSLYTVMSLRERDLDSKVPTRPGPLGVPNVLVADELGSARYKAVMPNPFPVNHSLERNCIVNVVLL